VCGDEGTDVVMVYVSIPKQRRRLAVDDGWWLMCAVVSRVVHSLPTAWATIGVLLRWLGVAVAASGSWHRLRRMGCWPGRLTLPWLPETVVSETNKHRGLLAVACALLGCSAHWQGWWDNPVASGVLRAWQVVCAWQCVELTCHWHRVITTEVSPRVVSMSTTRATCMVYDATGSLLVVGDGSEVVVFRVQVGLRHWFVVSCPK